MERGAPAAVMALGSAGFQPALTFPIFLGSSRQEAGHRLGGINAALLCYGVLRKSQPGMFRKDGRGYATGLRLPP